MNVTPGRTVNYNPSQRTLDQKFKKKHKKTYAAVVTDVNADSVDLTVYGVGEIVFVNNVKHAEVAEENRSSWDWPVRE